MQNQHLMLNTWLCWEIWQANRPGVNPQIILSISFSSILLLTEKKTKMTHLFSSEKHQPQDHPNKSCNKYNSWKKLTNQFKSILDDNESLLTTEIGNKLMGASVCVIKHLPEDVQPWLSGGSRWRNRWWLQHLRRCTCWAAGGTKNSHQDTLLSRRESLHRLETLLFGVSWEFG